MSIEEFLKSLKSCDNACLQLLGRLKKKEPDIVSSIDWQIIWYCRRQLETATKIVPDSTEISAHLARCFLELEIVLKWLKQDSENYKIFWSDAEFAMLDLWKSKKEAIDIFDPSYTEKYSKGIAAVEASLLEKGHIPHSGRRSPLYNIKETAKKIDEKNGKLAKAKLDFFSKMSHPTAWLITMDPNSNEVATIKREAMAEIRRALITIINTLDDSYKSS